MSHSRRYPRLLKVFSLLLFLGLCVFGLLFFAPQGFGWEKEFTVKKGEGVNQVSRNLKTAGLIRSRVVFETAVWVMRKEGVIQEGTFTLSNRMSVLKMIGVLTNAARAETRVTIPEGLTLKEIYRLFEEKGITSSELLEQLTPRHFPSFSFLEGVHSLEGFVFPETYFFRKHSDPASLVAIPLREFQKRMLPLYQSSPQDRSFYETLIMASIIEAEIPHEEDRAIVSGILWKRLDAGMPLQVDSTLNYATGGRNARLTAEELTIDSPYNTYMYPHLPPTPIGNPGESAMRAAANPKHSPYWFFLSGRDGTTHFGRDFEEHKRNKEKYLR